MVMAELTGKSAGFASGLLAPARKAGDSLKYCALRHAAIRFALMPRARESISRQDSIRDRSRDKLRRC